MNDRESTSDQQVPPAAAAAAPVPSRPHWIFAVLGAVLPVFFICGGGLFFLLLGRVGEHSFEVMVGKFGPFLFVVLGLAFLSTVACAVLLVFEALSWRVPTAVLVGVASLPWLAGVAGTALGNHRVIKAIAQYGIINAGALAAGLSEAVLTRMLGALLSGALLSAVGLAWAASATGFGAPGRRALGALIGIGSALPLAVLAAVFLFSDGLAPAGAITLLAGLATLLTAGLAGAGADPPHARNADLAAAAPVAAGLSFVAAATYVHSWATGRWLEGLALFGPTAGGEMADPAAAAWNLRTIGAILALLPIVALAIWAWTRSRPYLWPLGATALCLLAALAVFGLDRLAGRPTKLMAEAVAAGPQSAQAESIADETAGPDRVIVLKPPPARPETAGPPEPGPPEPEPELDLAEDELVLGIPDSPPPAEGPVRFDGATMTPPTKISGPNPVYPEMARRARVQGVVILEAVIGQDGGVKSPKVLRGMPLGLSESAVEAVEQWQFEPATLDGEPVEVVYTLTVTFKLE